MRVLSVTHGPSVGGGVFDELVEREGHRLERWSVPLGAHHEEPDAYDAVMVFIDAMKRAGSTDPKKFLPEVGKTRIQGVIGPIAFDDKGDLVNGPITIYVVKGGKWQALETVTPGSAPAAEAKK